MVNKSDPLFVVVTVLPNEMVEPLRIIPALPLVLTAPEKLLAPVDAFSIREAAAKLPLAVTPFAAEIETFCKGVVAPTLPVKVRAPVPVFILSPCAPLRVLEKVMGWLVLVSVVLAPKIAGLL